MGEYFRKQSHKEVVRSYNHGVELTAGIQAELGILSGGRDHLGFNPYQSTTS